MLCFSACTLESDSKAAGDLAGMWHCVYIEKGAASVELKDQKVYWSFQGNLLLLEDKAGNHSRILYHFTKNGNTLELKEPYRYDRENGDETTYYTFSFKFLWHRHFGYNIYHSAVRKYNGTCQ